MNPHDQQGLEIHTYDEYQPQQPPKAKRPMRKWFVILIVLILVAGSAGAYWYMGRKPKAPAAKANTPAQQAAPLISSQTQNHSSPDFNLSFDYPTDWTVTDTLGSGVITVRSPALQLKDAQSQSFTGQIVFTIRSKQVPLPEFDKGNATAIRVSEKIAYSKPSASQRGSTYISFLNYASSAGSTLDGIYVTGDVGYQKDQAIPKADIVPIDPVVNVSFVKCANSSCNADGAAIGIAPSAWDDAAFSGPLKKMLQSLTIN